MSTRLEQAQKDYEDGVITHRQHQAIVIEERNKEILGLQARLREADKRIRDLESARPEGGTLDTVKQARAWIRKEHGGSGGIGCGGCELIARLDDYIASHEPQKEPE